MRFVSPDQRKAVFANMFTKRRELKNYPTKMFVDEDHRLIISSDEFPNVSFYLSSDIPPSETKRLIDELDTETLSGLKKVGVVAPRVMKAYNAESGFYTGEEERVPFGRHDVPKVIVPGETRGRKSDKFIPRVAKEIAGATFENMYNEYGDTDLPIDYLREEYLSQVYDDYRPTRDFLGIDEDLRQDLEDEVWAIRAEHRLANPTTMEARAWRMGKQPRVDVETFVDIPKRKYERKGKFKKKEDIVEEDKTLSFDDMMSDLYNTREVSTDVSTISESDWIKDSDIGYNDTFELLDTGKFEMTSRMDTDYLKDLRSYGLEHWDKRRGKAMLLIEKELQERGEL